MKISTLFLLVICATTSIFAQEGTSYTDDFSVSQDFVAGGVEGTIWDGYYFNLDGTGDAATQVLTSLKTDDSGTLVIEAAGTTWSDVTANGPFLYKNLKDIGADFECKVKVVGGNLQSLGGAAVGYFMPGIMVRAKDAEGIVFSYIQAFDRNEWNAVYRLINAPDVDGTFAGDNSWAPRNKTLTDLGITIDPSEFTAKNFPWMKLTKVGDKITAYISTDDATWYEVWSASNPDLSGYTLEVGLAHSTYTENSAAIVFDDFSLIDYSSGTSVKELSSYKPRVSYSNHKITINSNSNGTIENVKLYNINGSIMYSNSKVNSNIFSFPVSKTGLFILVTEVGGNISKQKVSVY